MSILKIRWFVLLRRTFGLIFTAKFLENRERQTAKDYTEFLKKADEPLRKEVKKIIAHELEHEAKFIATIREDRLKFIGNVVLGLNDGLIELTGALTGFAFAFPDPRSVAILGIITGVAATFSMSASAAMQAKYEEGKNPATAALYTGIAYGLVVFLLVAPFLIFSDVRIALAAMGGTVLCIITGITGYGSVLFDRSFSREFFQMAFLSLGVAVVTFLLGIALRGWFGLSI